MNNFFNSLFHPYGDKSGHGVMDRGFVSNHTRFIDHFLEEHPEVVKDQHKGWHIYWDKQVDQVAQKKAELDSVPDDGYGFHSHGPLKGPE
ncbi:DUF3460 family protein [Dechloromonas denitrificans]|nr:DUF3460 family protein [Dechloromonas denitrificans]